MYHYLFTNDLRISVLEHALKEAGYCFATNTVPTASEDKSINNNMMTLGFYFNLIGGSNCAKAAAKGNVRKVVLNFIKKFQFPNPRTSASLKEAKDDGITLVPMRLIVKLLYMISMNEGSVAYITRNEIRDFIFYNKEVAKSKNPDINSLYQSIKAYRNTSILPASIDTDITHRNWKHEDRQIREMVKILLWSGCVIEDEEGNLRIQHTSLTRSDKADIFEIVTESEFWEGDSLESYREYMDIEEQEEIDEINDGDENIYKKAAKIINEYVFETGYKFDVSVEKMKELLNTFSIKFSPETLKNIPKEQILKEMFYTSDSKNDCMCYWLEFQPQSRECFGSIAGGSSYKFGLFQRKEDNVWIGGNPTKPEELTDEEAVRIGCEIRDNLLKGAEIIKNAVLDSVEDYEKLDIELNNSIGKYASMAWVHKYYQMIFSTKFATWHSTAWQNHILYAYGIKPSEKYYGRSGQLVIIANYAKMYPAYFAHASYDKFGEIRQFCRIGTSDGENKYFAEWKKNNIVAIGWNDIGSLQNYIQGNYINKKAIADKLKEIYYPEDSRTASRKAGEISTFYHTSNNTIFVAMDGETLFALGDSIGTYYYEKSLDMANCKTIKWHMCFNNNEKLPNKSEGHLTSCIVISDADNLLYLYHKYYYEMREEEEFVKVEEKVLIKRSPRTEHIHSLNQIIYGAPGTGKTYSSIEYAVAIIEKRAVNTAQLTQEERRDLMDKYENFVKNGQITFTTFHQSYGYEEFIQGIRPDSSSGTVNFKKADGLFKKIADKALPDIENNYVIIIDEINRGNISKIFGELITLIEEDKRCGEINQLSATLPLGDTFTIPNNLYIIGTMNSADKSISLIDTALRRRFTFIEMAPNEDIIDNTILQNTLRELNAYLRKELRSTDLLLGHSFFIGKNAENLGDIMNNNIIPLLYEYFYDDEAKVKKALACINATDFEIDGEYCGRIRIKKKV